MLQVIHKYYRSVLGIFFSGLIALSMLFFGMDMGGSQSDRSALQVNDREVSFAEFSARRQEVQEQFARTMGENFSDFAPQFFQGLDQRLVDSLIDEILLQQYATEVGLSPGRNDIAQTIRSLFPDGYSDEKYAQFLRGIGADARGFEARLAMESLRSQLERVLEHSSTAEREEAMILLRRAKTRFNIEYVPFEPSDFVQSIPDPQEEELLSWYDERVTEYEVPEEVSFLYAEVLPEKFEDTVQVYPEDVELYYSDNEKEFRTPERVRLLEIVLQKPEDPNPAALLGVNSLAEEIEERAQSGEDFHSLALEFSDVKPSSPEGSWIMRGDRPAAFDQSVFTNPEPGAAGVVDLPERLVIYQIVEHEEETPKPLEEVRDEIEQAIRKRDAPSYAAVTAQEIFDQWFDSEDSLSDLAEEEGFEVKQTEEAYTSTSAPEELSRLVRRVLEIPQQQRQLIELPRKSVFVEITEHSEAHFPKLDSVRDKVLRDWKLEQAKEKAQEEALSFFNAAAENEGSFEEIAEERSLARERRENYLPNSFFVGPLSQESFKSAVVSLQSKGLVGSGPFQHGGIPFVAFVTEVIPPDEDEISEELEEYREVASQQLTATLIETLLGQLKKEAEIEVNPAVYNN